MRPRYRTFIQTYLLLFGRIGAPGVVPCGGGANQQILAEAFLLSIVCLGGI